MSWNYRVLMKKINSERIFTINEVYYDKKGNPNGYIESPSSVYSDGKKGKKGMKWQLKMMKKALKKPVLSMDAFPKKYKKKKK